MLVRIMFVSEWVQVGVSPMIACPLDRKPIRRTDMLILLLPLSALWRKWGVPDWNIGKGDFNRVEVLYFVKTHERIPERFWFNLID